MSWWPKHISKKQASDTGMGLTLLMLLLGYFLANEKFYLAAIPLLVITMVFPRIFTPVGYIWFGVSTLIGSILSRILLTLVFIIFVGIFYTKGT